MFTVANILTIARIFLAPIFLVVLLTKTVWGMHTALVLFTVGALTDYFDGLLARRYGQVSELGMELDPLADKILTSVAFVALFLEDVMPLWMVVIIIIRDFGTTVLRGFASAKGRPVITSRTAKAKTFFQMCFIVYGLVMLWLGRTWPDEGVRRWAFDLLYSDITQVTIFAITVFTLWTAVEYLFTNRSLFRRA